MFQTGLTITALAMLLSGTPTPRAHSAGISSPKLIATHTYSLANRHKVERINDVFADNMLLTLAYMRGIVEIGDDIPWDEVRAPFSYGFVLKSGETFAFHDVVSEQFDDSVVKTTNSHFIASEKFLSSGWLYGDGVCHLASFIRVVADDADLAVVVPKKHYFANIPDVNKVDGVSIYYSPSNDTLSENRNLYITNTRTKPIAFIFEYKNDDLTISVKQIP